MKVQAHSWPELPQQYNQDQVFQRNSVTFITIFGTMEISSFRLTSRKGKQVESHVSHKD